MEQTATAREKVALCELKDMGWTDSLVKDFLPPPELKTNPHYKKAAPMKLWNLEQVHSVMETDAFKTALEKVEKRRTATRKGIKKQIDAITETALKMAESATIKIVNESALRENTLREKALWYDLHEKYESDVYSADDLTKERWIVNYIRHRLTVYDACVGSFFGKVGTGYAYVAFKTRILERIAELYPAHKEECYRQISYYTNEGGITA